MPESMGAGNVVPSLAGAGLIAGWVYQAVNGKEQDLAAMTASADMRNILASMSVGDALIVVGGIIAVAALVKSAAFIRAVIAERRSRKEIARDREWVVDNAPELIGRYDELVGENIKRVRHMPEYTDEWYAFMLCYLTLRREGSLTLAQFTGVLRNDLEKGVKQLRTVIAWDEEYLKDMRLQAQNVTNEYVRREKLMQVDRVERKLDRQRADLTYYARMSENAENYARKLFEMVSADPDMYPGITTAGELDNSVSYKLSYVPIPGEAGKAHSLLGGPLAAYVEYDQKEFDALPLWKKVVCMAAGPLANIIVPSVAMLGLVLMGPGLMSPEVFTNTAYVLFIFTAASVMNGLAQLVPISVVFREKGEETVRDKALTAVVGVLAAVMSPILLPMTLLHEAGHYAAFRSFGVRNVRLYIGKASVLSGAGMVSTDGGYMVRELREQVAARVAPDAGAHDITVTAIKPWARTFLMMGLGLVVPALVELMKNGHVGTLSLVCLASGLYCAIVYRKYQLMSSTLKSEMTRYYENLFFGLNVKYGRVKVRFDRDDVSEDEVIAGAKAEINTLFNNDLDGWKRERALLKELTDRDISMNPYSAQSLVLEDVVDLLANRMPVARSDGYRHSVVALLKRSGDRYERMVAFMVEAHEAFVPSSRPYAAFLAHFKGMIALLPGVFMAYRMFFAAKGERRIEVGGADTRGQDTSVRVRMDGTGDRRSIPIINEDNEIYTLMPMFMIKMDKLRADVEEYLLDEAPNEVYFSELCKEFEIEDNNSPMARRAKRVVRDVLDRLGYVPFSANGNFFIKPDTFDTGHAFRPLSWWSALGLGGGVDWVALFTGGTGYIAYHLMAHGHSMPMASALSLGMLGIISLVFAVTSFMRVKDTIEVIRKAHPEYTLAEALTTNIGRDPKALYMLKKEHPDTYIQIFCHETFETHVLGLMAFIPRRAALKRIFSRAERPVVEDAVTADEVKDYLDVTAPALQRALYYHFSRQADMGIDGFRTVSTYPFECLYASGVLKAMLIGKFAGRIKKIELVAAKPVSLETSDIKEHIWVEMELFDGESYYVSLADGQFDRTFKGEKVVGYKDTFSWPGREYYFKATSDGFDAWFRENGMSAFTMFRIDGAGRGEYEAYREEYLNIGDRVARGRAVEKRLDPRVVNAIIQTYYEVSSGLTYVEEKEAPAAPEVTAAPEEKSAPSLSRAELQDMAAAVAAALFVSDNVSSVRTRIEDGVRTLLSVTGATAGPRVVNLDEAMRRLRLEMTSVLEREGYDRDIYPDNAEDELAFLKLVRRNLLQVEKVEPTITGNPVIDAAVCKVREAKPGMCLPQSVMLIEVLKGLGENAVLMGWNEPGNELSVVADHYYVVTEKAGLVDVYPEGRPRDIVLTPGSDYIGNDSPTYRHIAPHLDHDVIARIVAEVKTETSEPAMRGMATLEVLGRVMRQPYSPILVAPFVEEPLKLGIPLAIKAVLDAFNSGMPILNGGIYVAALVTAAVGFVALHVLNERAPPGYENSNFITRIAATYRSLTPDERFDLLVAPVIVGVAGIAIGVLPLFTEAGVLPVLVLSMAFHMGANVSRLLSNIGRGYATIATPEREKEAAPVETMKGISDIASAILDIRDYLLLAAGAKKTVLSDMRGTSAAGSYAGKFADILERSGDIYERRLETRGIVPATAVTRDVSLSMLTDVVSAFGLDNLDIDGIETLTEAGDIASAITERVNLAYGIKDRAEREKTLRLVAAEEFMYGKAREKDKDLQGFVEELKAVGHEMAEAIEKSDKAAETAKRVAAESISRVEALAEKKQELEESLAREEKREKEHAREQEAHTIDLRERGDSLLATEFMFNFMRVRDQKGMLECLVKPYRCEKGIDRRPRESRNWPEEDEIQGAYRMFATRFHPDARISRGTLFSDDAEKDAMIARKIMQAVQFIFDSRNGHVDVVEFLAEHENIRLASRAARISNAPSNSSVFSWKTVDRRNTISRRAYTIDRIKKAREGLEQVGRQIEEARADMSRTAKEAEEAAKAVMDIQAEAEALRLTIASVEINIDALENGGVNVLSDEEYAEMEEYVEEKMGLGYVKNLIDSTADIDSRRSILRKYGVPVRLNLVRSGTETLEENIPLLLEQGYAPADITASLLSRFSSGKLMREERKKNIDRITEVSAGSAGETAMERAKAVSARIEAHTESREDLFYDSVDGLKKEIKARQRELKKAKAELARIEALTVSGRTMNARKARALRTRIDALERSLSVENVLEELFRENGILEKSLVFHSVENFASNAFYKGIADINMLEEGGIPALKGTAIALVTEARQRQLTREERRSLEEKIDARVDKLFLKHEDRIREEIAVFMGRDPKKGISVEGQPSFLTDMVMTSLLAIDDIAARYDGLNKLLPEKRKAFDAAVKEICQGTDTSFGLEDHLINVAVLDLKISWAVYRVREGKMGQGELEALRADREEERALIDKGKNDIIEACREYLDITPAAEIVQADWTRTGRRFAMAAALMVLVAPLAYLGAQQLTTGTTGDMAGMEAAAPLSAPLAAVEKPDMAGQVSAEGIKTADIMAVPGISPGPVAPVEEMPVTATPEPAEEKPVVATPEPAEKEVAAVPGAGTVGEKPLEERPAIPKAPEPSKITTGTPAIVMAPAMEVPEEPFRPLVIETPAQPKYYTLALEDFHSAISRIGNGQLGKHLTKKVIEDIISRLYRISVAEVGGSPAMDEVAFQEKIFNRTMVYYTAYGRKQIELPAVWSTVPRALLRYDQAYYADMTAPGFLEAMGLAIYETAQAQYMRGGKVPKKVVRDVEWLMPSKKPPALSLERYKQQRAWLETYEWPGDIRKTVFNISRFGSPNTLSWGAPHYKQSGELVDLLTAGRMLLGRSLTVDPRLVDQAYNDTELLADMGFFQRTEGLNTAQMETLAASVVKPLAGSGIIGMFPPDQAGVFRSMEQQRMVTERNIRSHYTGQAMIQGMAAQEFYRNELMGISRREAIYRGQIDREESKVRTQHAAARMRANFRSATQPTYYDPYDPYSAMRQRGYAAQGAQMEVDGINIAESRTLQDLAGQRAMLTRQYEGERDNAAALYRYKLRQIVPDAYVDSRVAGRILADNALIRDQVALRQRFVVAKMLLEALYPGKSLHEILATEGKGELERDIRAAIERIELIGARMGTSPSSTGNPLADTMSFLSQRKIPTRNGWEKYSEDWTKVVEQAVIEPITGLIYVMYTNDHPVTVNRGHIFVKSPKAGMPTLREIIIGEQGPDGTATITIKYFDYPDKLGRPGRITATGMVFGIERILQTMQDIRYHGDSMEIEDCVVEDNKHVRQDAWWKTDAEILNTLKAMPDPAWGMDVKVLRTMTGIKFPDVAAPKPLDIKEGKAFFSVPDSVPEDADLGGIKTTADDMVRRAMEQARFDASAEGRFYNRIGRYGDGNAQKHMTPAVIRDMMAKSYNAMRFQTGYYKKPLNISFEKYEELVFSRTSGYYDSYRSRKLLLMEIWGKVPRALMRYDTAYEVDKAAPGLMEAMGLAMFQTMTEYTAPPVYAQRTVQGVLAQLDNTRVIPEQHREGVRAIMVDKARYEWPAAITDSVVPTDRTSGVGSDGQSMMLFFRFSEGLSDKDMRAFASDIARSVYDMGLVEVFPPDWGEVNAAITRQSVMNRNMEAAQRQGQQMLRRRDAEKARNDEMLRVMRHEAAYSYMQQSQAARTMAGFSTQRLNARASAGMSRPVYNGGDYYSYSSQLDSAASAFSSRMAAINAAERQETARISANQKTIAREHDQWRARVAA
ncbi:MAG: hypothetical protein PHQ61_07520, partial [Candidatus Omnitrophica bacterium]|nr:hypothetical protein [Candidatus Omnitrophota bacterium]